MSLDVRTSMFVCKYINNNHNSDANEDFEYNTGILSEYAITTNKMALMVV